MRFPHDAVLLKEYFPSKVSKNPTLRNGELARPDSTAHLGSFVPLPARIRFHSFFVYVTVFGKSVPLID